MRYAEPKSSSLRGIQPPDSFGQPVPGKGTPHRGIQPPADFGRQAQGRDLFPRHIQLPNAVGQTGQRPVPSAPSEVILENSKGRLYLLQIFPGVQGHGGDDDKALDDVLVVLIEADECHAVGDDGEHEYTGRGAGDFADAPAE